MERFDARPAARLGFFCFDGRLTSVFSRELSGSSGSSSEWEALLLPSSESEVLLLSLSESEALLLSSSDTALRFFLLPPSS